MYNEESGDSAEHGLGGEEVKQDPTGKIHKSKSKSKKKKKNSKK